MGRGPRTIQYDPTRSLTLVSRWVRAVQAARGAIHTRATSEAPDGCGTSVPDGVSEFTGHAGAPHCPGA